MVNAFGLTWLTRYRVTNFTNQLFARFILICFPGTKKTMIPRFPDGSYEKVCPYVKKAFEDPTSNLADWAPIDVIWTPRKVYLLEMMPKDPYYNYGRSILYVDTVTYVSYAKEIYTKGGEYWKTTMVLVPFLECAEDGMKQPNLSSFYLAIDTRSDHSSIVDVGGYPYLEGEKSLFNTTLEMLGPLDYTQASMIQKSK